MADPIKSPGPDNLGDKDDIAAVFELENRPVRGRIVRLGPVIDDIIGAHDYPEAVAELVGEAVLLALLIGESLKFDGRLIIQASGSNTNPGQIEGAGPVFFVVADYVPSEGVRGFAKFDRDAVQAVTDEHGPRPGADKLLGAGTFAMTLDQGPGMEPYQGVVAIEGSSLARSAEHYFFQSEQVPTRFKLATGQHSSETGTHWRAGGAILQKLAGDDVRSSDMEDFNHALALFDTTDASELLDPDISAGRLLYRLFHEDGVRVHAGREVTKRCTCERQRLARILASFPDDDRDHMSENGVVVMTCEYCNRDWRFEPEEIEVAGRS